MVIQRTSSGRPIWTIRGWLTHQMRRDWRFVVPRAVTGFVLAVVAVGIFYQAVDTSSSDTVAIVATGIGATLTLIRMPTSPLTTIGVLAYAVMLFGLTGSVFRYFANAQVSTELLLSMGIGIAIAGGLILSRARKARREYLADMKFTPQVDKPVAFETGQGPPYCLDKLLEAAGICDYSDLTITLRKSGGAKPRTYLEIEK